MRVTISHALSSDTFHSWLTTGGMNALSQWCIMYSPNISKKFINFPRFLFNIRLFVANLGFFFPLFWPWRIYASCLTRTGSHWPKIYITLHYTTHDRELMDWKLYKDYTTVAVLSTRNARVYLPGRTGKGDGALVVSCPLEDRWRTTFEPKRKQQKNEHNN